MQLVTDGISSPDSTRVDWTAKFGAESGHLSAAGSPRRVAADPKPVVGIAASTYVSATGVNVS
jgi:hypothetical protein